MKSEYCVDVEWRKEVMKVRRFGSLRSIGENNINFGFCLSLDIGFRDNKLMLLL